MLSLVSRCTYVRECTYACACVFTCARADTHSPHTHRSRATETLAAFGGRVLCEGARGEEAEAEGGRQKEGALEVEVELMKGWEPVHIGADERSTHITAACLGAALGAEAEEGGGDANGGCVWLWEAGCIPAASEFVCCCVGARVEVSVCGNLSFSVRPSVPLPPSFPPPFLSSSGSGSGSGSGSMCVRVLVLHGCRRCVQCVGAGLSHAQARLPQNNVIWVCARAANVSCKTRVVDEVLHTHARGQRVHLKARPLHADASIMLTHCTAVVMHCLYRQRPYLPVSAPTAVCIVPTAVAVLYQQLCTSR